MLVCVRVVVGGSDIGWNVVHVGVHVMSYMVRCVDGSAGRIVVGIRGWVCCVGVVGLG